MQLGGFARYCLSDSYVYRLVVCAFNKTTKQQDNKPTQLCIMNYAFIIPSLWRHRILSFLPIVMNRLRGEKGEIKSVKGEE